ncbi:squalene synthase HpnC [Azohydromonas lata]|uniref:Squalene synthase HpnC n=1 Tax=Azohydromonas lata TaxID=45677 RepID=A0ABU5IL06_9BURK|nr:squalene synthase HpnC [Azohydromonas lata]MDZ5459577.1 squalene synthase HpnC [Azohydromonas lata]
MSIDHYENFPVASVLCPPSLRPAVVAIYHFARTADDIADEGDAPESQRLADLAAYRIELQRCAAGESAQDARWLHVFGPLAVQMRRFALPPQLLADLLSAFEQDTGNPRYPDRATLLDYCRRSADPIGRLLLHLYGVRDAVALQQSDAICSALQLINFWQDFSVDLPRGRHYAPVADAARHGLTLEQLQMQQDSPATRAMVRELCLWARELMLSGAPLVHRLPGRAGWELRLVVQGGLRILEKIEQMNHATLARRPKLAALDAPRLLWRALGMRARPATARSPA